jgi:hypothetical protein
VKNTVHSTLFLDIDDVLCLNDSYGGYDLIAALKQRQPNPEAVFREVFSPRGCAVLQRVHAGVGGNVRYVISSTWRKYFGLEQLRQVFKAGGLGFAAEALHQVWCTPDAIHSGARAIDIAIWMAMWHEGEPFAILDDTYSGPSLKPALMNPVHPFHGRVVLCDEKVGLLPEHVEPLVEALQRPFTGSHAPLEFARHADLPRSALPSPDRFPAVLDTSAQMGATVLVARNFHRRLKTAVHCEASRVKCFGGGLPRIPAVHRDEHLLGIAPPQLNQRRTRRERR